MDKIIRLQMCKQTDMMIYKGKYIINTGEYLTVTACMVTCFSCKPLKLVQYTSTELQNLSQNVGRSNYAKV